MTKATTTANGGTEKRSTILTIPNQLTLARLVLAVIFFALLACFGHGLFGDSRATTLNWAMGLFILAVSTDFLDGYLARRWGMVSTFGRIADPFADKIIICGSFIMLIERPRASRIAPTDAAVMPLPNEDTTPPVINTNLGMNYPVLTLSQSANMVPVSDEPERMLLMRRPAGFDGKSE